MNLLPNGYRDTRSIDEHRADTFLVRTTASVMPDMRGDSLKYTCQVSGDRWLRSTHTLGMHLEEELRRGVP